MILHRSADASYRKLHDELLETFANDVNYDEESDNLEQHEESVEKALSVVHQLIAVFKVHSNSIQILAKLDSLERQMNDQPEKSFQSVISKLQERYEAVENILRDSTIPLTHIIRRLVLDLEPRILNICSIDK